MKAVADLLNLFIASAYIAQVGIGCVPMPSSFFHMASLNWVPPPFPSRHKRPAEYDAAIAPTALSQSPSTASKSYTITTRKA